ncbi:MAG: C39 family peptidase [Verrucomicrobia bacterium]|nr:C39 family peptidase [Verrucomicrobiota bacterium]
MTILFRLALLLVLVLHAAAASSSARDPASFLPITDFSTFAKSAGGTAVETVITSPEIRSPNAWDEVVVSWNAESPSGCGLKFEARAIYTERTTKYYCLGVWSEDEAKVPRESVNGQRDADGDVKTDTLVLKRPAQCVQLRITFVGLDGKTQPRLRFLGLSFLDSGVTASARPPNCAAWGRVIDVPRRSQVPFGKRQGWCSPTSVSMVLAHWAKALGRSDLDISVPETARGVFDRNWPGTGNWAFNTAFAGRFHGLRACVARLNDIADLEDWIVRGAPPVVSVSYSRLYGGNRKENDGHLIVVVGFTKTGDVVANDPWTRLDRSQAVRRTVFRKNFMVAWRSSHNTAYLIYPEAIAGK